MRKAYYILLLCIAILSFYFIFEFWNQNLYDERKIILHITSQSKEATHKTGEQTFLHKKTLSKLRERLLNLKQDELVAHGKPLVTDIQKQTNLNEKEDTLFQNSMHSLKEIITDMIAQQQILTAKKKFSYANQSIGFQDPTRRNDKAFNSTSQSYNNKTTKIYKKRFKNILVYTRHLMSEIWPRMKATSVVKEIDGSQCSVDSCSLSYNKTQLLKSDAILFHEPFLPPSDILRRLRRVVPQSQIWIWNLREPPTHLLKEISQYQGLFNWTCTYSPASEVYDPIFHIVPLPKRTVAVKPQQDFSEGRTKMIFAAINNCFDERILMIKKLKQLVSFDVYGSCGRKVDDGHLPPCPRFTKTCTNVMREYRFYFAMENSYCDHYITEKYYQNGLQSGLIPIVLGGASYGDSRVALNHSFINVEDFDNLESLVDYLKHLASNKTAFNQYFWWKDHYKIERHSKACAVCKRLWQFDDMVDGSLTMMNQNITTTGKALKGFWDLKKSCKTWMAVISKYI